MKSMALHTATQGNLAQKRTCPGPIGRGDLPGTVQSSPQCPLGAGSGTKKRRLLAIPHNQRRVVLYVVRNN